MGMVEKEVNRVGQARQEQGDFSLDEARTGIANPIPSRPVFIPQKKTVLEKAIYCLQEDCSRRQSCASKLGGQGLNLHGS